MGARSVLTVLMEMRLVVDVCPFADVRNGKGGAGLQREIRLSGAQVFTLHLPTAPSPCDRVSFFLPAIWHDIYPTFFLKSLKSLERRWNVSLPVSTRQENGSSLQCGLRCRRRIPQARRFHWTSSLCDATRIPGA